MISLRAVMVHPREATWLLRLLPPALLAGLVLGVSQGAGAHSGPGGGPLVGFADNAVVDPDKGRPPTHEELRMVGAWTLRLASAYRPGDSGCDLYLRISKTDSEEPFTGEVHLMAVGDHMTADQGYWILVTPNRWQTYRTRLRDTTGRLRRLRVRFHDGERAYTQEFHLVVGPPKVHPLWGMAAVGLVGGLVAANLGRKAKARRRAAQALEESACDERS